MAKLDAPAQQVVASRAAQLGLVGAAEIYRERRRETG
jgi:hypothetical protein